MKSSETGDQTAMPDFRLRESRRARRLSIRVSPHAGVEVVVPRGTPVWQAERLVHERRDWIDRAVSRLQARGLARWQQVVEMPRCIDFAAVNLSWPVQWRTGPVAGVRLRDQGSAASVEITSHEHAQLPVAAMHQWLLSQGRLHLAPWLQDLARERGLHYERVRIAGQRTLWGSCSPRGTISLNYRLLFLPPRLCRYVLMHELCHLLHRNHSPRFWNKLEALLPGASALDRELRRAGPLVPGWVECLRQPGSG